MATDDGAVQQRKTKTKSEEKKRKHVEVEADAAIASKKKSKLVADSIPQHSLNGEVLVHRTSSPMIQDDQNSGLTNGSHIKPVNGSEAATTTPQKKKKKDKSRHSQTNGHGDDVPFSASQASSWLSPISTKKSKPLTNGSTSISSPQSSNKKPESHSQMQNSAPAVDQTTAMDIDHEESQSTNYISETPYIQRSVKDVLSTAAIPSRQETSKSPFFRQAVQLYVPLSPITLTSALEGACAEHLSPLLLKYYPPLHGVVLSYAQPRFSQTHSGSSRNPTSQTLAISVAEYTTPMIWLEVEFLLFKPARGHAVEGVIVLQSESHVGLHVYNLFSGRIARERLPPDWTWNQAHKSNKARARKGKLKGGTDEQHDAQQTEVEAEVVHDDMGHWVDGTGKKIEGVLEFWVWNVEIALGVREAERNLPTIEGTLLEDSLRDGDAIASNDRRAVKQGKRKA